MFSNIIWPLCHHWRLFSSPKVWSTQNQIRVEWLDWWAFKKHLTHSFRRLSRTLYGAKNVTNQPTNQQERPGDWRRGISCKLSDKDALHKCWLVPQKCISRRAGGWNERILVDASNPRALQRSSPCHLQFVRVGDTTENLGCRLNCKKSPTCIIANMPGTQKPGREIVKPCRVKIMRWWRWMKVDNEGPAFAPRGGWIHFGPKPPKSGRWWGDRKKWSNPGASEETAGLWGRRRWCQRLCERGVGLWCRPRCRWWRRARVLENGRNKIFQSSLIPPTDNSKSILTVFSRIIGT